MSSSDVVVRFTFQNRCALFLKFKALHRHVVCCLYFLCVATCRTIDVITPNDGETIIVVVVCFVGSVSVTSFHGFVAIFVMESSVGPFQAVTLPIDLSSLKSVGRQ